MAIDCTSLKPDDESASTNPGTSVVVALHPCPARISVFAELIRFAKSLEDVQSAIASSLRGMVSENPVQDSSQVSMKSCNFPAPTSIAEYSPFMPSSL